MADQDDTAMRKEFQREKDAKDRFDREPLETFSQLVSDLRSCLEGMADWSNKDQQDFLHEVYKSLPYERICLKYVAKALDTQDPRALQLNHVLHMRDSEGQMYKDVTGEDPPM